MAHTPGPWRVEKEKWDLVVMGSDEDYIAYVPVEEHILPEESANARLIAAAPSLVEALEKAPKPMPSLTAEEWKANWKAVDHWFAVYDTWMDDIAKKALAQQVSDE